METSHRRLALASLALIALCATASEAVTITMFPAGISGPAQVAASLDGRLWVSSLQDCVVTSYFQNGTRGFTHHFDQPNCPSFLTVGPDAFVWVTVPSANAIWRLDTRFPWTTSTYTATTASSAPYGIAFGPDGAAYFSEFNVGKLGRISPWEGFVLTEYDLPIVGGSPVGVATGHDGVVWLALSAENRLAEFLPGSKTFVMRPTLWTAGASPFLLTAGPDGNMYYTQRNAGRIGLYDSTGGSFEWIIPTAGASPYCIALGPDGNLWFTEYAMNKIGRMTPAGVFTEWPLAPGSHPMGIAADTYGHVWFAANGTNQIGMITVNVAGDTNGDGLLNVGDVFYLINFLFAGGPAPKS